MDKKYQKIATPVLCFLAVFLLIGLPLLVQAQTSVTDGSISHTDVTTVGAFAGETWYQILMQWVIGGFGTLVAMIGWALDWSIQNFILGFGEKYQSSNLGDTINSLWGMVRDIFNLTFIFGLIFIGFKMILDAGDSHARHTLVSLIGAALLVNFSLFITKFVVDFSDLAAYKIFEAFKSNTSETASISVAFANLLGVSSLFDNGSLANAGAAGSLLYLTGSLLVLLVLAYVYLAGAVLIAIRFVVLTIYLVFSPVMFLGWVFPSMHKRSEDYWHGFLGQAFFAPAFLFMLYLSYRIVFTYNDQIQKHVFDSGGGYFNRGSFTQADSMIPFFIMTITFLIASMVVAKNMGAVGAGSVIKVGNQLRGRAQGILYRNTGGRLAKGAVNVMDRTGMSTRFGGETMRNGLMSAYKYGAGGTSLEKVRHNTEHHEAEVTKNLSRMQTEKDHEEGGHKVKTAAHNRPELDRLRGLASTPATYAAMSADDKTKLTDLEKGEAEAKQFITGLSKSEIEELKPETRAEYAAHFSADQTGKIMDSEKISTGEKGSIAGSRKTSVERKITTPTAGGGSSFTPDKTFKLTKDEIDSLGVDWVSANSHLLTGTQLDDWTKSSKKLTPELTDSIKQKKKAEELNIIGAGVPGTPLPLLAELAKKPKEFVKLPKEVFLAAGYEAAYQHVSSGILEEIAKEGTLDQAQRFQLKREFTSLAIPWHIDAGALAYLNSDEGKKKYGP